MIDIFLLCLIVVNAADCQTLHPDLNQLIPKDLLPSPPDNLLHPYHISLHNNNNEYNIINNNNLFK